MNYDNLSIESHDERMYRKCLSLWGYHGVYVSLHSKKPSLFTVFWKDEYQINFDINIVNCELSYDELRQSFFQILMFAASEKVKNITPEDNIGSLLENYLIEKCSFDNVQYRRNSPNTLFAHKNNIEYSLRIYMCTEEDHSLDKFEEDHDEILELNRTDMVKLLEEKGLTDFEVEVAPDFLSVKISIRYNQKIHHLDIHSFYDDWFYMWSTNAGLIANCYWAVLYDFGALHIEKFEEYLQEDDFFDIDSSKDSGGNDIVFAYHEGCKYGIKISIENEVIPFDNMEGHTFERFCADVLAKNGFERIRVTQGSGDQGVDIIAYKDDVKYGIQCKCYSSDIGNRAVQEVFAGKTFYQCHIGVVLTNRYFTKSAIELAQRNGIVLWNRDRLLQMVENYYKKM